MLSPAAMSGGEVCSYARLSREIQSKKSLRGKRASPPNSNSSIRQQKSNIDFAHMSFLKRRLTPGQPASQPVGKVHIFWARRRTPKLFCLVNWTAVPRTGPLPEQKAHVNVHHSFPPIPTFFHNQARHFYFSHGPYPLLRGGRPVEIPERVSLSRFSVGCRLLCVRFDRNDQN